MAEFFNMNGHGPYIWTGYIVTVLVLGSLAFARYRDYSKLDGTSLTSPRGKDANPPATEDEEARI